MFGSYGQVLSASCLQNLRDEMAMDVDEDEDGTQRPRETRDYGIEVDFEELDEDDREVTYLDNTMPNAR